MVKVYVRVCYLCNLKGELKEATYFYYTPKGEAYDVCDECAELCSKQGFTIYEITEETEIEME